MTTGEAACRLDEPVHVADYTATISPRVALNADGTAMVVIGACSARILGHRAAAPVYVTFAPINFTYNLVTKPSQSCPVGVDG